MLVINLIVCRLYCDDCIIYMPIDGTHDVVSLQNDLNKLHEWSKKWLIKFNLKKCKVIHLTRKCCTV